MTSKEASSDLSGIGNGGAKLAGDTAVQFIAFSVGEQTYCVDIMSVREIRAWAGTTNLPNTAEFVRGVINRRGIIVPIIDLRTRFGHGVTDPTKAS